MCLAALGMAVDFHYAEAHFTFSKDNYQSLGFFTDKKDK